MCVIFIVEEKRPTEDMVRSAWKSNDDGGGVAWREADGTGGNNVHWKKGIEDVDEMVWLCENLPLPYVAHFRVASSGGIRPSLTHPFEVSESASAELEGVTKNYVQFHNGDWRNWRDAVINMAARAGFKLPDGKYSDSRAMALLGFHLGPGYVELLDEKVIWFGPDDERVFTGAGWVEVNGVWCSNSWFFTKESRPKMCRFGRCTRNLQLDADGYCFEHRKREPTEPVRDGALGTGSQQQQVASSSVVEGEVVGPLDQLTGTTSNGALISGSDSAGAGGAQLNAPFRALLLAESQHKAGKLSKRKLKRVRKAYDKAVMEQAQAELAKQARSLPK